MSRARRVLVRVLVAGLAVALIVPVLAEPSAAARAGDEVVASRLPQVRLRTVARGLDNPLFVGAPRRSRRLFVVEQRGTIRVIRRGRLLRRPFLDIRGRVRSGGEQGLLGLAFHPRYRRNGRFFVHYTNRSGDTRVVEYRRSPNFDRARPRPRRVIFSTGQPYSNHNGGMLAFGPDGMLYAGLGDGGSGGDPHNHGQRRKTPLGALLRFDVNRPRPFVPRDNPWRGGRAGHRHVWAYGLRNPWRFAFDPPRRRLFVADVGQDRYEEINVVPIRRARVNYGWRIREGRRCYSPPTGCRRRGLHQPIRVYNHDLGCSVTGGYVYRGSRMPRLRGHYFYGDFCQGWIRSFRVERGRLVARRNWSRQVGRLPGLSSFGVGGGGELYLTAFDGTVRRLVPRRR